MADFKLKYDIFSDDTFVLSLYDRMLNLKRKRGEPKPKVMVKIEEEEETEKSSSPEKKVAKKDTAPLIRRMDAVMENINKLPFRYMRCIEEAKRATWYPNVEIDNYTSMLNSVKNIEKAYDNFKTEKYIDLDRKLNMYLSFVGSFSKDKIKAMRAKDKIKYLVERIDRFPCYPQRPQEPIHLKQIEDAYKIVKEKSDAYDKKHGK